ncbi:Protein RER1 [Dirofilaria immitis]|nr:Protein RER1 [Dirofilaria immitis]
MHEELSADLMEDSSDLRDRPSIISRFSQFDGESRLHSLLFFFGESSSYKYGFLHCYLCSGNLLFKFIPCLLTPKIDPALDFESDDEDGPTLPSKGSEEFRPFMRRLPEFKFWYSAVRATVIAFTCTFFDIFNVPVFWPILVMYFIVLTCLTMKRQIMHMIKYRYIPFTTGKPRMRGKEDSGVVVQG